MPIDATAHPHPTASASVRTLARHPAFWAAILGGLAFAVYHLSLPGPTPHDHYVRLADAFLHGRVDLRDSPIYLEVTRYQGRAFVMNPPFPAILLLPYVALRGLAASQALASHLTGAVAAAVTLLVAARLHPRARDYVWLGLLGAFGTILWYLAAVGSTWYFAHVVAVAALTLGVLETLGRQRPWLLGIAVAAAYWSRLPTILALPFVLIATLPRWAPMARGRRRLDLGYLIRLGTPVAAALALNMLYNWVRFGTIADVAAALRPGIFEEPWFQRGLFHPSYIPRHLRILFAALPVLVPYRPYLLVPWGGLAIWLTTPVFVYALRAPRTLETLAAWAGILPVATANFLFGNPGVAQFGYRFATDFYPLLFLLAARGMSPRVPPAARVLIALGILVNAWGVFGTRLGWVAP